MTRSRSILLVVFAMLAALLPLGVVPVGADPGTAVFINEFHYDNTGTDTGEAIEIAGPAGTDLAGWSIVLYNGNGGAVYNTAALSGTIPDNVSGFGFVVVNYPTNGIQNGSPDGIALVDAGNTVIQFLSYEGAFTAVGGPANGMLSTDIGVSEESGTPVGDSLQLAGSGTEYEDFSWSTPAASSFGSVNIAQTFGTGPVNEPVVATCGDDIFTTEGTAGSTSVSATDADGTVTAGFTISVDPVPSAGSITLANPVGATGVGGTATVDVVADDLLPAGTYTVTVTAFNDDSTPQSGSCSLTVGVVRILTIPEIQGNGQFSPYLGETVQTSGIVTAITANGRDMWIQDPLGDGDPSTSDGIFVDDRDRLTGEPVVGDLVVIIGEVEELQFGNALPLTRIDDTVLVEISSSGNPLPAPVALTDQPNESVADAIAALEPLEGMRVSAANGRVVGPTSRFGEFAFLAKPDAVPGSGYYPQTKHILLRSTGTNQVDYNPERILVDDSTLDEAIQARPGDLVRSLVGVMDYTFGNYKIQPTGFDLQTIPVPMRQSYSTRSGPAGDTVITTFNVENLFDTLDNPLKDDDSSNLSQQELEIKLKKLARAIEVELRLPSIIVVQETENTEVLQQLGDLVNLYAGTDYVATSFETSDGRGIEVGFLWDAGRVDLLEAFQLSGPDIEAAFGPGSASPGREPLYGKFQIGGEVVHIVGNHFKSKGGDDPVFGVNWPPIRITEVQRKLQAQAVRNFVDVLLAGDPGAKVMVTGDLNDFQFGEPGEGPDHPVAILEDAGGPNPLTNLINREKDDERWTFVFDGNSQVLDHTLVNGALLAHLVGVDVLHFNAGYPDALGDDEFTTLRASDHDAVEARFALGGPALDVTKPSLELDLAKKGGAIRFSTFNASLNRFNAGDLVDDLSTPDNAQAQTVAEIIQRARPDVLLVNEFDYDAEGLAAAYFQDNYLSVSQNGADPIVYPYRFVAPSNTGIPSGFDLDNNGSVGGPNDAFGFGFFPGQFGMAVYSMYPIDGVRTFQNFLWKDMPGALLPDDPGVPGPADWYSPAELDVFRLSSKSHWDVPIRVSADQTIHFLVSHPTPPVFDGPEDRNGTRNHDEIRFWADYVDPGRSGYIYDDAGGTGGLPAGARFVVAGDQNSDPFDGDSIPGSAQLLIEHPLINNTVTPSSPGGAEQAALQGRANATHQGDPAFDTADFNDSAPGNLRADYVLPDAMETITGAGVFWPLTTDPLFSLVGTFPFPSSDHRLVWVDFRLN